MEIRVQSITVADGDAIVMGQPTNDGTKTVVAGSLDVASAVAMAIALQEGTVIVDVPETAVMAIFERAPEREA